PKVTNPLSSPKTPSVVSSAPVDSTVHSVDQVVVSEEPSIPAVLPREGAAETASISSPEHSRQQTPGSTNAPAVLPPRNLTQATPADHSEVTAKEAERGVVLVTEEDLVIFEQMRHQLVVWIRIEAVRAGVDIGAHQPAELLELLQLLDGFDETRLQVTSTL